MTERWRCTHCEWVGPKSDALIAEHPFDPDPNAYVNGCRECKSVDHFVLVCDVDGCKRTVSCGTPTPDGGYRNTCGEHRP